MGVIVKVREDLSPLTSQDLEVALDSVEQRFLSLRAEAQDISNSLEAIRQGKGNITGLSVIQSRASTLEVEILSAQTERAEITVALLGARVREAEASLSKHLENMEKQEKVLSRAEQALRDAKAPYYNLLNAQKAWQSAQDQTMRDLYDLRAQQQKIIAKTMLNPSVLPPPKPDFFEAMASGKVRAPEDSR